MRPSAKPAAEGRDGPITSEAPGRVLLILAGLIGDTVMSTPVIVEARRLWPQSWITVLGNRQTCELLSACPLIDACVEPRRFRSRYARGGKSLSSSVGSGRKTSMSRSSFSGTSLPRSWPMPDPDTRRCPGAVLAPFLPATYDIGSLRTGAPRNG